QVMPGGLARVSEGEKSLFGNQGSGLSKDVWIRSNTVPGPMSIARSVRENLPERPEITPSRTGENLFWTGRYAERTYAISRYASRMIEGNVRGFARERGIERRHEQDLVRSLCHVFDMSVPMLNTPEKGSLLQTICLNPHSSIGLPFNLKAFRRAAMRTREEWSPISMRAISETVDGWVDPYIRPDGDALIESRLDDLQLSLTAFLGLNLDNMTRDEGWALLDAGRRVERAAFVLGILGFLFEAKLKDDVSTLFNESLLVILDSARTYQAKYQAAPHTHFTLQLLLGEKDYPRSVLCMLLRLQADLDMLPEPAHTEHPRVCLTNAIELTKRAVATAIDNQGADGNLAASAALIEQLRDQLADLSDRITTAFFSLSQER
ncbi:MAG: alpha-E domain-containing protein, partial [Verrucomicrobiota bacterium]